MSDFNYFSKSEQDSQARFRDFRDRLWAPVARWLLRHGVTANMASAVGIVFFLPFIYLVLTATEPWHVAVASLFLIGQFVFDSLDGPLARHSGTDGRAGGLVDISCDQGAFVVAALTLAAAGLVNPSLVGAYVLIYTVELILLLALNLWRHPLHFAFRSKYFVTALMLFYGLSSINFIDEAIALFTLWHAVDFVRAYRRVYRVLARGAAFLSSPQTQDTGQEEASPEQAAAVH